MTSQRRADLKTAESAQDRCFCYSLVRLRLRYFSSSIVAGKVDLYGSYSFGAFTATSGR